MAWVIKNKLNVTINSLLHDCLLTLSKGDPQELGNLPGFKRTICGNAAIICLNPTDVIAYFELFSEKQIYANSNIETTSPLAQFIKLLPVLQTQ